MLVLECGVRLLHPTDVLCAALHRGPPTVTYVVHHQTSLGEDLLNSLLQLADDVCWLRRLDHRAARDDHVGPGLKHTAGRHGRSAGYRTAPDIRYHLRCQGGED